MLFEVHCRCWWLLRFRLTVIIIEVEYTSKDKLALFEKKRDEEDLTLKSYRLWLGVLVLV